MLFARINSVLLPADNAEEALLIEGMKVYGLRHLNDLPPLLTNQTTQKMSPLVLDSLAHLEINRTKHPRPFTCVEESIEDYSDVLGQRHVKRALTIAAAGMHNIMLIGPPGTGKTMLIRRLPSILPPLSQEESLEVTKIYSSAGKFKGSESGLITRRPFRSPHHTISAGGLIGGGGYSKAR